MLSDHVGSDVGVPAHDLLLFLSQRPWLVEDVISNAYLAEIVQRPGSPAELALAIAELELFAEFARKLRYADRVRLCIAVARVESLRSQVEGLILKLSLTLCVSNVAPHRQDEPKETRRHDVTNGRLQ